MADDTNDLISEDEKLRLFRDSVRGVAERLGVNPDLVFSTIRFGSESPLTEEDQHEVAKAFGVQMAVNAMAEYFLPQVKTREQMTDLLRMMKELQAQAPTIARRELKKVQTKLARNGGPGRAPLLDSEQQRVACEKILAKIGEGAGVKDATAQVASIAVELFGKSVSARTLESIWSDRAAHQTSEAAKKANEV